MRTTSLFFLSYVYEALYVDSIKAKRVAAAAAANRQCTALQSKVLHFDRFERRK